MIIWILVCYGVKLILSCWVYNGEIIYLWFLFRKKLKKKKINNVYMYVMFVLIDFRLFFKYEDDKVIF